jgi:hypothetical protein
LAGGFFLVLILLLGQRVWSSIKNGGSKWWPGLEWVLEIGY